MAMRPGWHPLDEETQKPTEDGKVFERAALSVGIGFLVVAIALAAYLFGCTANGQEAPVMLMPEIVFDGTNGNATLLKRPAQPPIPALRKISRTVSTNDAGERVTVTVEKPTDPPALIRDKPKTNSFWVMCPHCEVRAIRTPQRMEIVGSVTTPDGDIIERTIYFRCCQQEFRARNFKRVEVPIAEEVTVPVK